MVFPLVLLASDLKPLQPRSTHIEYNVVPGSLTSLMDQCDIPSVVHVESMMVFLTVSFKGYSQLKDMNSVNASMMARMGG